MTKPSCSRGVMALLLLLGAAMALSGCGKTLVFAERDGVNLAIRSNASSTPPLEVNFGLNRTIATIVPPAGETGGKPDGEAVNMFASFQVDNTLDVKDAPLKADLKISTQFASGAAATAVADNPRVVAQLVNARELTFSGSDSSQRLFAWLYPKDKRSKLRFDSLQDWLKKRYPGSDILPGDLRGDPKGGNYEAIRRAALDDKVLMATAE